jgi:2-methylcitrate dehydratase PrpD
MSKVVLVKDQRIDEKFPKEWAAIVGVVLKDGKRYEKHVRFPKGDPENPLTWDELAAKFTSLALRALPGDRCNQITTAVSELKPSSDLSEIWKLAASAVKLE